MPGHSGERLPTHVITLFPTLDDEEETLPPANWAAKLLPAAWHEEPTEPLQSACHRTAHWQGDICPPKGGYESQPCHARDGGYSCEDVAKVFAQGVPKLSLWRPIGEISPRTWPQGKLCFYWGQSCCCFVLSFGHCETFNWSHFLCLQKTQVKIWNSLQ